MTPAQEEKLNKVANALERIEIFLVGDEALKTDGLKQKVDYHARKIQEYQNDKLKVTTGATIFGIIGGAIAAFITKIISGNN